MNMWKKGLAAALAAAMLVSVAGCGKQKGGTDVTSTDKPGMTAMDIWTCDALSDVFMDEDKPQTAGQDIDLHLAKNEREGGTVAYANKRGMAKDMTFTVTPFAEQNAPVLEIFVTGYSEATRNSGYITAKYKRFDGNTMVPSYYMGKTSAGDVEPFVSGGFWVEAVSTASTAPGQYKTKGILSSSKGQVEIPITVTVYDVTLPDPKDSDFSYTCWGDIGFHYANNFGTMYSTMFNISYFDDNYWELQKNFAIAQKNERQNVCIIPLSSVLHDGLTIDEAGTYTFDFTTFDKYVSVYLENGSFKYLCGSHLLDKDWYIDPQPPEFPTNATVAWIYEKNADGTVGTRWARTDTPEARKHLRQLLTALQGHLKEKGWDKMWMQHVCDEAGGEKQTEEILSTYKLVHEIMPDAKTVDAGGNMYARYRSELNFPTPQLDDYDARREEYRRANAEAENVDVWFYTCTNPQRSFMSRLDDFPLLSTRALGWYAYKEGVKGYLHWSWNLWYTGGYTPLQNIDHPGGPLDGWLVFPNIEEYSVYEGPRSVATRDGFEDRELMVFASQKDDAKVQETLNALIEWGNKFDRDHTKYLEARKMFLEMASK